MRVEVKICGLKDQAALVAAIDGGASYAGFVFYRKSPRFIDAEQAVSLIGKVPSKVTTVGLFVDADDDEILGIVRMVPLRAIQLHGQETHARVAQIHQMTGLPVIKAVGIAAPADIALAQSYEAVADMVLLDAKPGAGDLPGGNGAAFDWALLRQAHLTKPWFLAGGLTPDNVAQALAATGATRVDVSSGVESAPGIKNIEKIRVFIATARK